MNKDSDRYIADLSKLLGTDNDTRIEIESHIRILVKHDPDPREVLRELPQDTTEALAYLREKTAPYLFGYQNQ